MGGTVACLDSYSLALFEEALSRVHQPGIDGQWTHSWHASGAESGSRLSINMSSYQYRDPMLKIRRSRVSPTCTAMAL